jgi:hypothetical protein
MDDSFESLFTLDTTTLFYWTLSKSYTNKKRKQSDLIREWAAAVLRAQQRQARLTRLLPKTAGI